MAGAVFVDFRCCTIDLPRNKFISVIAFERLECRVSYTWWPLWLQGLPCFFFLLSSRSLNVSAKFTVGEVVNVHVSFSVSIKEFIVKYVWRVQCVLLIVGSVVWQLRGL